ncbi:hypothetical protein [Bosea sp. CRIB-10]|nr:hypothetical protein [Bosea sp. CRIB-10]
MSLKLASVPRLFGLAMLTAAVSAAAVMVDVSVAQAYDITSRAPINVTSA